MQATFPKHINLSQGRKQAAGGLRGPGGSSPERRDKDRREHPQQQVSRTHRNERAGQWQEGNHGRPLLLHTSSPSLQTRSTSRLPSVQWGK